MRTRNVMAFAGLVCAAVASSAQAQITPTGPFTGTAQEGFQVIGQWPPAGPCTFCTTIPGAFGGICDLVAPNGGANIHCTGGWGFTCSIGPHATPRIAASTGGGGFDYVFSAGNEAGKFGGYFGTNCGVAGGTAEFYDAGGTLVGSQPLTHAADCQWVWHGWTFSTPIAKVRIIGNFGGGGYVQMDDMEYEAAGGNCYPDCNGDGVLTAPDFGCYQTKFVAGDMYADCNGDGVLTAPDFGCFQTKFVAGCP